MGLPDRDSAKTWGGKLLVDRDGTEIGTCTEIFMDDATGLPEWATADLNGGPAMVPLLDATEAGDQVRVAVRQADVVGAPTIGHGGHMSQDEEERLYQHYGITVSRETSESLLPAEDATAAPSATDSAGPADAAVGPEVADVVEVDQVADVVELPVVADASGRSPAGLVPALAAGVVGVLAVVAAAVYWWRQRRQVPPPPTRKELLAARAQAASLAMGARRQQFATTAAPLLRSGREISAATARRMAVQARLAADRSAAQARVAAEAASVQARIAAEQAAALAATARTLRIQRVVPGAELEPQPAEAVSRQGRWLPFRR